MASAVLQTPALVGSFPWFRLFLREELTPYPGRTALVARMVLTATIVFMMVMTFQIPYGAYAALFTLTIPRENPEATLKAVTKLVVWSLAAVAYALIGAAIFLSEPMLRMEWILATLFLVFLGLSTASDRAAANRFGYMLVIIIPLWDSRISADQKVRGVFWAAGAIAFASLITAAIELIYAGIYKFDAVSAAVLDRLDWTQAALRGWAVGSANRTAEQQLARLAILGTSRMRRELLRSGYAPEVTQQWGAIVALAGRLVDLAANLNHFSPPESEEARRSFSELADRVDLLGRQLATGDTSQEAAGDTSQEMEQRAGPTDWNVGTPLLKEMERAVSNLEAILRGFDFPSTLRLPAKAPEARKRFLVADAFTNANHIRFAIRGSLAAAVCYMAYNLVHWPEIHTALTTCFLTALTTVGSSRQKQVLRFGGAVAGGVVGMCSQVFVLPGLDSIASFVVLFMATTMVAAWISTSGPRLSYLGVQFAFAFYLINLEEFRFQTSLTVARDRVAGILLGLLAMWLIFDQLWGAPAIEEMERAFVSTLRLLAKLMREPEQADSMEQFAAIEQSYARRETLNTYFENLRQAGDGVMLEFGPSREKNLAWRSRLLDWQLQLRMIFIRRIALLKYRLRLTGFELPDPILEAQQTFDCALAKRMDEMADQFQGQLSLSQRRAPLLQLVAEPINHYCRTGSEAPAAPRFESLLLLCAHVDSLVISLAEQIGARDSHPGSSQCEAYGA